MTQVNLAKYKATLGSFLQNYIEYSAYVRLFSSQVTEGRTSLQRQITLVARIIDHVVGNDRATYHIQDWTPSFHETLAFTLTQTPKKHSWWENANSHIIAVINEGIGNIENNTLPSKETEPVIPIKDETLRERCLDLLQAPGNFDRVINQATQVFEAKLRDSIPYEKLCEVIPEAREHIGEPLANKLLSPRQPLIVISDNPIERAAFHKMVVGIIAYLRNPSHHLLDDKTEWALAWSVVGIIDALLSVLKNAYTALDTKDNKPQRTQK